MVDKRFSKITLNGKERDYDAVVALMDDELREQLHQRITSNHIACTNQQFIDRYTYLHFDKYQTEFTVD